MRILTFMGGIAVGGVSLAVLGARLAESACDPRTSDEYLPCLGETLGGLFWGAALGVLLGILAWWLLWRLWTRASGSPYSARHLLAVTGLAAFGVGGLAAVALLIGSPLRVLIVLACAGIVVLARGVRRDHARARGARPVHAQRGGRLPRSGAPATEDELSSESPLLNDSSR